MCELAISEELLTILSHAGRLLLCPTWALSADGNFDCERAL